MKKVFTKESMIVSIFLSALIEHMEEQHDSSLSIEQIKGMKKDFEVQALR